MFTHTNRPLICSFRTLLPKGFTAFLVFFHMMLQRCRITLAKAVDVHYGYQVVKLVVGGKRHGLPDSTLGHLAIPQQAVHTITENRVTLYN